MIIIQDKWKKSKPTLQNINYFMKASERIGATEGKSYFCIYLSKMLLSLYAIKAFEFDNIHSSNKFYCIHSEILEEIEKKYIIMKEYIKQNIFFIF